MYNDKGIKNCQAADSPVCMPTEKKEEINQ